jgi:hypothetical protein
MGGLGGKWRQDNYRGNGGGIPEIELIIDQEQR